MKQTSLNNSSSKTRSLKNSGLIWLIVTIAVFVIDIMSKFIIHHTFYYGESIRLFSFFSISYRRNTGAAFSILEGQRGLLAIVAVVISIFIIYMLYKNGRHKKFENFSLALILGGALGNLFDRIYHGYVIDFFDVNFGTWHYPTFNLADCAICVGIACFIWASCKTHNKESS
ncbi:signal peptidase II [Orbus hercynius]|uniref:Lipoprotein signal peptidase n=1 Tax=Orbus hercynius TaxID=593135 RepID=A0A495RI49_9GAMM|nr:signal peptidase II [Orbus hercynius]RKS86866.1 signal peptidase II [Orbus hercynius]